MRSAHWVSRLFSWFIVRFFNLLYHQFAWTYDAVAWLVSVGRWKQWVLSTIPLLKGDRILELGHGPGHLQAALANQGVWTCGIDESYWMSRLASKNTSNLVNSRAQNLPFNQAAFSQVVATFPSEYIFDMRTLSEVDRVLVPGGNLVILPIAWITGKKIIDKCTAWLFLITHQAPPRNLDVIVPKFTKYFSHTHFSLAIKTITLQDSELLILIATKPG